MLEKRKSYTKIALALSICLVVLWGLLGTGASIAWFVDESPELKNTFNFAEFKLKVSHKLEDGSYEPIDSETEVFDSDALYEPGYVQVVYLKVENEGEVSFEYKLAVNVNSVTVAKSVLGNDIYLPNYLKYGVLFSADEAELTREMAKVLSTNNFAEETGNYPLNTYSEKDSVTVPAGGERYIAIIVRMPEEVGNVANYRGEVVPRVELGLTVTASQEGSL